MFSGAETSCTYLQQCSPCTDKSQQKLAGRPGDENSRYLIGWVIGKPFEFARQDFYPEEPLNFQRPDAERKEETVPPACFFTPEWK
jgi:hypothetical protein